MLISILMLAGLLLNSAGAMSQGDVVIGDLRLIPQTNLSSPGYYQPLVYFTDGLQRPQYGGICYDGMTRTQPKVICNQLGYELDHFIGVNYGQSAYPVWLDDVQCEDTKNLQHILSCSYNVTFGNQTYAYPCSTHQYLAIKCDWTQPLTVEPYDGQILLCPPDQSNFTTSSSFGLVSMYLEKYGIWRGLNQRSKDSPLGLHEANAICQQLGYTTAIPGSALASSAVTPNFTFDKCYTDEIPFKVQREAWLATDSINCTGSKECFTCCYAEYPENDNCNNCDYRNDIVIQCTFDPTKLKPLDESTYSPDTCQLKDRKPTHCEGGVQAESNVVNTAAIAVSVIEAIIIAILLAILVVCCCCMRRCKAKNKTVQAEATCCFTSTCDKENAETQSLT